MKKTVMAAFILSLLFLFPQMIADTQATNQLSQQKFPYWGFMLYQNYNLYQGDSLLIVLDNTTEYYYWSSDFYTSIHVIGVGRHQLRCEIDWDIYYYDLWAESPINFSKIRHWNDSRTYTEDLWSFRPFVKPHVHPRKQMWIGIAGWVIINGSTWSRIYLDGELIWKEEIIGFEYTPQNPHVFATVPHDESNTVDPQPECRIGVASIILPPPYNNTEVHRVNVSWYENTTGSWVLRQTDKNVTVQGPDVRCQWTYTQANHYNHKYWWKVVVDDGTTAVTKIYHFKTKKSRFSLPWDWVWDADSFIDQVIYLEEHNLRNNVLHQFDDKIFGHRGSSSIWLYGLEEK